MMPKYRSRIASCSFSLSFTTGSASAVVVVAPERRCLSLSLSFSRSSIPFRSRSLRSYFSRGSRFSRANNAVTGTSPNFGTFASDAAFMAATSSWRRFNASAARCSFVMKTGLLRAASSAFFLASSSSRESGSFLPSGGAAVPAALPSLPFFCSSSSSS
uniref:Uncharacterized protein n=1 Tax=Anopheles braziliensis TaxID=58242 RepID=A0A2M3ZM78_9DIPT